MAALLSLSQTGSGSSIGAMSGADYGAIESTGTQNLAAQRVQLLVQVKRPSAGPTL